MQEPWFYVAWAAGAYLLGSVSTGDLVARVAGVEIRRLGTGNPGAANIYREIGARHAAAVLLLDIAKGAAATLPLYLLGYPAWAGFMATAAVLTGHFLPVMWRFEGGTGLATGIGTTFGLLPIGALIAAPIGIGVLALSRNAGATGVTFFVVTGLAGGLLHRDAVGVAAVGLAGLAVVAKAWLQYPRT